MLEMIPEEVFCPASYPNYTYIGRRLIEGNGTDVTYEDKLKKAMRIPGNLVTITGPSKSGKTVLCHRVIPFDNMVALSGSQLKTIDSFWQQIAENIAFPVEIAESAGTVSVEDDKRDGSAGVSFLNIAKMDVNASTGTSVQHTSGISKRYRRSNNDLIRYMIESRKVLIIDDFHYIDKELQLYIARILKAQLFYGLKAIVVTLPHRSDEAIRRNPDLIGRTTFINIAQWACNELMMIGEKGFSRLGIPVSDVVLDELAQESLASPQLMQENCLLLAQAAIDEQYAINRESLKQIFATNAEKYSAIYENILSALRKGPSKGKSQRKLYHSRSLRFCDVGYHDIYQIIIDAICIDPPVLSISLDEIKERIMRLLEDDEALPRDVNIINPINHIADILRGVAPQLDALEWRNQRLYILDPFLLFFLRWERYI